MKGELHFKLEGNDPEKIFCELKKIFSTAAKIDTDYLLKRKLLSEGKKKVVLIAEDKSLKKFKPS